MEIERFSLLLLDPGEIYFEDFSVVLINVGRQSDNSQNKRPGRIKMCSKSLVFEPKNMSLPLIKIPFKECKIIEKWKSTSNIFKDVNVINVVCNHYIEMLAGNVVAPYKTCDRCNYLFQFDYADVEDCLRQICQLHRASKLLAPEQADMIAAIVHSRQSRIKFNPLWLHFNETILYETQADKIMPLVVNPGKVVITQMRLYFQPYNNMEPHPVIKIDIENIKQVIKRRFLLKHIGLEICLENSNISHIYFAFRSTSERDALYNNLLEQELLKLSDLNQDVMTLQWQNGILSNYDYLLYVNSLGDRTVNDFTQYPVFPWVILDYKSEQLDLTNPKIYRDLSKPVGALNPERLKRLLERTEEIRDLEEKYIYGTHYSTPGFVLFYLVRMYPKHMLCFQNGQFDNANRMFNSIPDLFKNCYNNMSDFKELLPEFYDVDQEGKFLVNNLGINFGIRADGTIVNDVTLPPWAKTPKDFIVKLRDALESDYVSQNLHHWIDLIFGYKQRGKEAKKANNLFYPTCYEGAIDLDKIKNRNERHAQEVQIMEFGQIPKQVFTLPHPQRNARPSLPRQPSIDQNLGAEAVEHVWNKVKELKLENTFGTHKDAVSSILISEDSTRIISVGRDCLLKIFSLPHGRQLRSASVSDMSLSSCVCLPNRNVIVVGSWDSCIIFYDLDFGCISQTLMAHHDAVSCMKWSNKGNLLASGSWDCSVRIWHSLQKSVSVNHVKNLFTQLDHESHVLCIAFNFDDTQLATGTKESGIFVWNIFTEKVVNQISGHSGGVYGLCFSPDGRKLVSCGQDGVFQVIDLMSGMALFRKILHCPLLSLAWDGSTLFLGCQDGVLYIWDLIEVKLVHEAKVHKSGINSIVLSPNKKFLATAGEDRFVKVWLPL